jgi:hypothetical protein
MTWSNRLNTPRLRSPEGVCEQLGWRRFLRGHGIQFVGSLADSLFPMDMMHDTLFHPTEAGATLRTRRFLQSFCVETRLCANGWQARLRAIEAEVAISWPNLAIADLGGLEVTPAYGSWLVGASFRDGTPDVADLRLRNDARDFITRFVFGPRRGPFPDLPRRIEIFAVDGEPGTLRPVASVARDEFARLGWEYAIPVRSDARHLVIRIHGSGRVDQKSHRSQAWLFDPKLMRRDLGP